MNRSDLIEAISKETGHTKADADRFISAFIDTVKTNMKKKEGVRLQGFGTFLVAKRKARIGRNPKTGKALKIPARTVPKFRPGMELKQSVQK